MTHASVPAEQREALGTDDGLICLSVVVENVEDLLAGLEYALPEGSARQSYAERRDANH